MKYGSKKPLAGLPAEKLHPYRKYGNVMKKAPSPQAPMPIKESPMDENKRKLKQDGEL